MQWRSRSSRWKCSERESEHPGGKWTTWASEKRTSPDSKSLRSSPNCPQKPGRKKCSSQTKCRYLRQRAEASTERAETRWNSTGTTRWQVRWRARCDVKPSLHQFKPCRFQEKCHMSDSAFECQWVIFDLWVGFLKSWCRCQQCKMHGKLRMPTERTVSVQVALQKQIQLPDTCSYDPKVQTKMCWTSGLEKSWRFLMCKVIDEVAKVSGSCGDVSWRSRRWSGIRSQRRCEAVQGALPVHTLNAGRTKVKSRKTGTSVHKREAKCKAHRESRVQWWKGARSDGGKPDV